MRGADEGLLRLGTSASWDGLSRPGTTPSKDFRAGVSQRLSTQSDMI